MATGFTVHRRRVDCGHDHGHLADDVLELGQNRILGHEAGEGAARPSVLPIERCEEAKRRVERTLQRN